VALFLIFRFALEVVEVLVAIGALPTVVTDFGVGNRATTMRADPIAAVQQFLDTPPNRWRAGFRMVKNDLVLKDNEGSVTVLLLAMSYTLGKVLCFLLGVEQSLV
jgi:hypothetical protein